MGATRHRVSRSTLKYKGKLYNIQNPHSLEELLRLLIAGSGSGFIEIPGPYSNDAAAASGGVGVGEAYRLTQVNDYDIASPEGRTVVVRIS